MEECSVLQSNVMYVRAFRTVCTVLYVGLHVPQTRHTICQLSDVVSIHAPPRVTMRLCDPLLMYVSTAWLFCRVRNIYCYWT